MLGLFGGTFDPVHHGHLRAALEVLEGLGLRELRLVPCSVSPHRAAPVASAAQRLRMLELAVAGHPGLDVDARELRHPAPSYTVDTLEALRAERPDETLVFVLGQDAFGAFERWHCHRRIRELAHLAVVTRPGFAPGAEVTAGDDVSELRARGAGAVVNCPVTPLDISASEIRRRLGAGRDVSFLLPEAVRRYALEHAIYGLPRNRYAER